jgi:hypothetical protein
MESYPVLNRKEALKIRRSLVVLAAVGALAVTASPAAAAGDKDCADFSTWRQAQNFYKKQGGPRYDPHRLDADRDGIACEDLR